MKNIRVFFLSEKFKFLEVKFSIYLNRRVFVMPAKTLIRMYIQPSMARVLVFLYLDSPDTVEGTCD